MSALQIVGRHSSLYTRVTKIFAEELKVQCDHVPIYDMTARDPAVYGDNPALKLPILRISGEPVFGTENICRELTTLAPDPSGVIFTEQLPTTKARNAQEMVWHIMQAQVQLVFGTQVNKLPADNTYFVKARAGLEGALEWVNSNLPQVLQTLPEKRKLSLLETTLFCTVEHLRFRSTVQTEKYAELEKFAKVFGERASAQATPYRFDVMPPA